MLSAEGECRIGVSIGPICSSMQRVSANSSASGISFQAKRGLPMSTVETSGSAPFQQLSRPAVRLEGERVLAGLAEHQLGDAAHAVAAGAGGRAVAVVDAHIGVGAGRARRVERHHLVVGRAGRLRGGARVRRRRSAPARRACRPPRSRCRDRSSSRMRGRRARSLDDLSASRLYGERAAPAPAAAHGAPHIWAGNRPARRAMNRACVGGRAARLGELRCRLPRLAALRGLLALAGPSLRRADARRRAADPRSAAGRRRRRSRAIRSARR